MADLKIPTPPWDKDENFTPHKNVDEDTIRILIQTVNMLIKQVDELEERIKRLEMGI